MELIDIEFPNNQNIRELLVHEDFQVDEFLFKNYRFSSIDLLIKELTSLNKLLDDELIELINANFNDFIRLGTSLNGSMNHINMINNQLVAFNNNLGKLNLLFESLNENFSDLLNFNYKILIIRFKINNLSFINNLINNFENYLNFVSSNLNVENSMIIDNFKQLINLFVNIDKLIELNQHQLINVKKFNSLLFELKSLMKQYNQLVKSSDISNKSQQLFDLFNFMKILQGKEQVIL